MMRFRTEIIPPAAPFAIDPERPVVLLGSCFTDNIGARMRRCGIPAIVNPGGVLFNPISICSRLNLALLSLRDGGSMISVLRESILHRDDIVLSWLFDSSVAALDEEECLMRCKEAVDSLASALQTASALLLTFGTSLAYCMKGRRDEVVTNCHKLPASTFERRFLSMEEIVTAVGDVVRWLRTLNPTLNIIMTVSPVRHQRDGMHLNTISKANLLLALDHICSEYDNCQYFPAYELLIDDLRDYRFYASDLVHPSEDAVEYIWDKFKETYFDEKGRKLIAEGESLRRRMEHRPIIGESAEAYRFESSTQELLARFRDAHPSMIF